MLVLPNEMSFPIMENYGVPPPPQGMLRVKVGRPGRCLGWSGGRYNAEWARSAGNWVCMAVLAAVETRYSRHLVPASLPPDCWPAHMQVVRGNKLKSQLLDKVDPYVTVEVGGWTCAACDVLLRTLQKKYGPHVTLSYPPASLMRILGSGGQGPADVHDQQQHAPRVE